MKKIDDGGGDRLQLLLQLVGTARSYFFDRPRLSRRFQVVPSVLRNSRFCFCFGMKQNVWFVCETTSHHHRAGKGILGKESKTHKTPVKSTWFYERTVHSKAHRSFSQSHRSTFGVSN